METAAYIEPSISEVVSDGRRVSMASVLLGGVPRGAVIVLSDIGASSADTAQTMNRLAEHGYESVAVDLGSASPNVAEQADLAALADVEVLVQILAERGWSREQTALVGYGYGGRVALIAAAVATFGAAVSIEPAADEQLLGNPNQIGGGNGVLTPWLGLFSGVGETTQAQSLHTLRRWLWSHSLAYSQIVTYPGTTPAFYWESPDVAGHAAAFDCWQRVIEWLNLRVVPKPTPLAEAWRKHTPTRPAAIAGADNNELESC